MVEWLKELSLFEHFLHGLLKYLNEDTAKQKPFQGQHHTYIPRVSVKRSCGWLVKSFCLVKSLAWKRVFLGKGFSRVWYVPW